MDTSSEAAKPHPSTVLARHAAEIKKIAGTHRALEVKVFGSVARGDDRPGCDVDLLVRFAPDASLLDQAGLAQDMEDLLGVRVDVVSEGGLRTGHDAMRAQVVPGSSRDSTVSTFRQRTAEVGLRIDVTDVADAQESLDDDGPRAPR